MILPMYDKIGHDAVFGYPFAVVSGKSNCRGSDGEWLARGKGEQTTPAEKQSNVTETQIPV